MPSLLRALIKARKGAGKESQAWESGQKKGIHPLDTKKNKTAKQALSELHLALAKTSDSLQELQYRLDRQGKAKAKTIVDDIIARAGSQVSETV